MLTNKGKLPFIIASATFVVAAAGVYFFQIFQHSNEEDTDPSIIKVESEDGSEKGSVNASLQYAGYVTLIKDKKNITLNFTNPSKAQKSLSLEVVANIDGDEVVLSKTNKIPPGYKVNEIKYDLDQDIPEGEYKGKFLVHFYNEQGEEEIVNSEIAIDVYVK